MSIKTKEDLLTVSLQEVSEALEAQAGNEGNDGARRESYTLMLRLTREIMALKTKGAE